MRFYNFATFRINPREIFDVLTVTGGVPRYLEEIEPGLSAEENIRRMCFSPSGELFRDFDAIFSPLFGNETALKRQVLEAVADGPLSGAELERQFGTRRTYVGRPSRAQGRWVSLG